MNELLFLGTGSAWGTPVLGCECAVCASARRPTSSPHDTRLRTALLLTVAGETFLIDAGPDIRSQLQTAGRAGFDFLLLTHCHTDHMIGLDELTPLAKPSPIPTFASPPTWRFVEQRFPYLIGERLTQNTAQPGAALVGPQTRVTPFAVEHGPTAPGALGFVFEWKTSTGADAKLVYTGDLVDVPTPDSRLSGADVLVMECNWFNEPAAMPTSPHMSFQRAIDFIEQWRPKQVFLVHMSHEDQFRPLENALVAPTELVTHADWRKQVKTIAANHNLPPITVAYDQLRAPLP